MQITEGSRGTPQKFSRRSTPCAVLSCLAARKRCIAGIALRIHSGHLSACEAHEERKGEERSKKAAHQRRRDSVSQKRVCGATALFFPFSGAADFRLAPSCCGEILFGCTSVSATRLRQMIGKLLLLLISILFFICPEGTCRGLSLVFIWIY